MEINESVEMQEVADPAVETGEEGRDVTAPESSAPESPQDENSGKSDADAAFARMRREKERYESELEAARAELTELREEQAQHEARNDAISRLTGDANGQIAALAEVTGMSEEDIIAEMEAAEESAQKELKIQQLEERLTSVEAERLMQEDLAALRRIDPSIASLEDLGDDFVEYMQAGLSPESAYWAIKAKEQANHKTPPKEMGKVSTGSSDKDHFTEAEIDAMSSEQLQKNWKKIFASWGRN